MSPQSTSAVIAAWTRLAAVLLARGYRASVLTLSAVAIAPMLFGWASFVIKSGSMEPSINVGDVVASRPYEMPEKIAVGRVYVFDDPAAGSDHLLTHRIVELRDDGSYTSAGDANEVTDFTPVSATDVEARAIILAPYVGLPVVWMQVGEWVKLALWLLLTIAAFVLATRNLEGEPPKSNMLGLMLDRRRNRRTTGSSDPGEEPPVTGAPEKVDAHRRGVVPAVLGVVLALFATGLGSANAEYTAQSRNSGNTWTTGPWVQPYVGAVLADAPTAFWLLDETAGTATAQDRSGNTVLGNYKPAAVLGQAGGLPGNPGTSLRTGGGLSLTNAAASVSPATHTFELWARTSSTTGGSLVGFGSSATTAIPPYEDRVLRITATGRITYGDWSTNQLSVLTTPAAYNNDAWHHVVVVSVPSNGNRETTTIYVDGVARVSGQSSRVETYTGYVRVGGGSGSSAFNGSIDNVSVYGTALSASRVAAHWAAR
ncbi:MAG: signal peptidase I [Nocardioides sp.]|uniref:signal peptidase I n=1 Tax=Nocardioides sp. TaxID=35761 RepID=UPI003264C600